MHRVIFGDSRSLRELSSHSAHLVVTSPPYWSIKDYGHPDQIGSGQSYDGYLYSLGLVFSECARVLHPGCRMAINIGDQYLRAAEHERYRVQPIPSDLIVGLVAKGLDFMGSIIWHKISTTKTSGGGAFMGSLYLPKDGHVTYEHEYILLFRKQGRWPRPTAEQQERSRLTKEQRTEWFRGTWAFPPTRQKDHPAAFPLELPRRLILMYSFWGETVLDPFLGSGSTLAAAAETGRIGIGYEINEDYRPVIQARGVSDVDYIMRKQV